MGMSNSRCISFTLGGMFFEYDEENSIEEDRFDTIGDLSAGQSVMFSKQDMLIGSITKEDVLFVVYTERVKKLVNGDEIEVTRLISARYATSFERGLYYGKY